MRWSVLVGTAAAALLTAATSSLAQPFVPDQNGQNIPGAVQFCIAANGKAIPCDFSDLPRPDVAAPNSAPSAGQRSQVVTISPNSGAPGQYPAGSIPITGNATGSTSAVVGTLAAFPARRTYICGFDVSAIGGTAAVGPVTVAGLVGSSMVYQVSSTAAGITLSRTFTPCIPASANNTAITITTTADGTATAVDVNAWGFQQ